MRRTRSIVLLCMMVMAMFTGCQRNDASSANENSVISTSATTTQATTTQATTTTAPKASLSEITPAGLNAEELTVVSRFCTDVVLHYTSGTKQVKDFLQYGAVPALNSYLQYAASREPFQLSAKGQFDISEMQFEEGYAVMTGTLKSESASCGTFSVVVGVEDGACVLLDLVHDGLDSVDALYRSSYMKAPHNTFWTDAANYAELFQQLEITTES